MANYLLTGVAGFIASNVARSLLAAGHTVIGVDNLNDAYDTRLKDWRLKQIIDLPGFSFNHLDIVDRAAMQALFAAQKEPFAAVINLAARAGVRQSLEDPWIYVDTNTTGTLNLLELARTYQTPKFVLASTSSLYGKDNAMPYREDQNTDRPLSQYAASKKGAEAMTYTYHHLYGIDVSVVRYFTVYGPAGRPDMSMFRFVQWISEGKPVTIFGDGSQSRDFTYVEDIAAGTVAALKPVGWEVINLGSDSPHGLMDVLHLVEDLLGKKANLIYKPFHSADVTATWADISKAERLLGWRPQFTIQEGTKRLVDWYNENRSWASQIET